MVFIILLGLVVVLEKLKVTNFYEKPKVNQEQSEKTTSEAATAQDNFTEGEERQAGNTINESRGSGGVTDSNGNISNEVSTSNPIVSKTKEISIYSPQRDTRVSSGYEIAGISSLKSVSYRLIDDISGLISSGVLKVVDGKFSGRLNFNTESASGRLDIYGQKEDGTEFSNIEIPLKLK